MYLKGFARLVEDAAGNIYDDGSSGPGWDAPYSPSSAPPTQSTDWSGLFSTAIRTWGDVSIQKEKSETAVALAPYQPRYLPASGQTRLPGLLPFLPSGSGAGTLFGIPLSTLFLLAAAGVAFYMMRR